ncbi:MFS transporter [Streptomyces sp. NPDC047117]|uniref:MFS transporter n=1 Tax=Streptomyces sp. NPDC047117 TaxID=3155379 RepID=UPI0033FEE51B
MSLLRGTAPEAVRQGPGPGRLLPALLLGVIAFQLNASMVTPALPHIAGSLAAPLSQIALSQTLFFLIGGVAGVVLSRLGDHLGRRRVLLGSLAVMCVGTVLAVCAPNAAVLIAGRILQGASGATFQLTYLVLRDTLSPQRFGTAMGLTTAINGGVGGVDGFLGGLLADRLGFRWIFAVILVVGLAAIALLHRVLPADAPEAADADGDEAGRPGRMDWWGASALSGALICVNLGIGEGSSGGWGSGRTAALLGAGVLLLAVFWQVEKGRFRRSGRPAAEPLIAVAHLKSRQVWPLVATTLLTLTGVFAAMNFTVVLLSQDTGVGYGMTATLSSLLLLTPAAAIGLGAAPLAGWLAPRRGWLPVLRTGLLCCALALAVAAVLPGERWVVIGAFCALGIFYNGLTMTTLNGLGVVLSPKESPGALPGLNGACFGIGASVGIAVVGPLAGAGTLGGYRAALWVAVGIALLALLTSLLIAAPEREATP